jgi:hypothetical protein
MQHLTGLVALLVDQLIADSEQAGEASLDNLVKVLAVVAVGGLVAEGAADGEQALQAGEHGARAVGVEQLHGVVHKARPFGREVGLQDALEDGDELLADETLGGGEERHEAISNAGLFIFGYQVLVGDLFGRVPGAIDPVLDVDDSCWEGETRLGDGISRRGWSGRVDELERRTVGSCSPWRISSRQSMKPACSSI